MERLIDADVLFKAYENIGWYNNADRDEIAEKILLEQPTVDPVKHGYWIREPNCWYRCSECGSHYPSIADNMNYHYCPDCGAKMTLD